ncbi:MAG: hypothetical protein K0U52_00015 [Gammaproteobacteria bacterium]|nr:hypothetical protein [Gammaproteobacteria bacterium]
MAGQIRGVHSTNNTNPAENNFFQISTQRMKPVVSRVTTAVYGIFKHFDDALTRRFYPKYREIVRAIQKGSIEINNISKTDSQKLLFLRFYFNPSKWVDAELYVRTLYQLEIATGTYHIPLEHCWSYGNTIEFYPSQPQVHNIEHMDKTPYNTQTGIDFRSIFPKLLNDNTARQIENDTRNKAGAYALKSFTQSIQFTTPTQERIDNVCGLLFFLKEGTINNDMQIDKTTFEISRSTYSESSEGQPENVESLSNYLQKHFTKNKLLVDAMIATFEATYQCQNRQNHPENFRESNEGFDRES